MNNTEVRQQINQYYEIYNNTVQLSLKLCYSSQFFNEPPSLREASANA